MSSSNMNADVLRKVDFRSWSDRERHMGSVIVIIAVAALLVIGIGLHFAVPDVADVALWVLVALVLAALAYQAGIVATGVRAEAAGAAAVAEAPVAEADAGVSDAEEARWGPPAAPEAAPDAAPESEAAAARTLTLRCGDCKTEFNVEDDGTRPLYHSCPGCGAEGVLRGEPRATAPAPEAASPAPAAVDTPPAADAAPGGAEAPARKTLKLRCGGCKHVFRLEDTGERPLRNRCPSCGRLGEIPA